MIGNKENLYNPKKLKDGSYVPPKYNIYSSGRGEVDLVHSQVYCGCDNIKILNYETQIGRVQCATNIAERMVGREKYAKMFKMYHNYQVCIETLGRYFKDKECYKILKDKINASKTKITRLEADIEALSNIVNPTSDQLRTLGDLYHSLADEKIICEQYESDLKPVDDYTAKAAVKNLALLVKHVEEAGVMDPKITARLGDKKEEFVDDYVASVLSPGEEKNEAEARTEATAFHSMLELEQYNMGEAYRQSLEILEHIKHHKLSEPLPQEFYDKYEVIKTTENLSTGALERVSLAPAVYKGVGGEFICHIYDELHEAKFGSREKKGGQLSNDLWSDGIEMGIPQHADYSGVKGTASRIINTVSGRDKIGNGVDMNYYHEMFLRDVEGLQVAMANARKNEPTNSRNK